MLDTLTLRLRENHLEASSLGLEIRYSKKIGGGFFHSVKLENSYDLTENFYPQCLTKLDTFLIGMFLEKNMPIRKVSISLGNLSKKESVQLNLFETFEEKKEKEQTAVILDDIKQKFGKNSLLYATSLLSYSTLKERNQQKGGA